jgi:hypothetical protein
VQTGNVVALITAALAFYILWHDGFHTLVTEGWGWATACAGFLYLLIKWIRQLRGVEPQNRGSQL